MMREEKTIAPSAPAHKEPADINTPAGSNEHITPPLTVANDPLANLSDREIALLRTRTAWRRGYWAE